ncbi:hypothetical protein OROGR_017158 [Orobanche gracilis]
MLDVVATWLPTKVDENEVDYIFVIRNDRDEDLWENSFILKEKKNQL